MVKDGEAGRPSRWEIALVGLAVLLAAGLGIANLGVPSLWHDELIHLYLGKSILETGFPYLHSGRLCFSGTTYNYLLAGVIACAGDGEVAVRLPSVLLTCLNVALTYLIIRRLLGRNTALVAAFALAISPWSVAWSREARFYTLQQTAYLAFIAVAWTALSARGRPKATTILGLAGSYLLGILTSLHSIAFLGPVGVYAFFAGALDAWRSQRIPWRWVVVCALVGAVGLCTIVGYFLALPKEDRNAVFVSGGLDGARPQAVLDPDRADFFYYPRFFCNNLSTGYFVLAALGFILMAAKEKGKGCFALLAFIVPILLLSRLGYRRYRFLFYAYPFYIAAFSYALVCLVAFLRSSKGSWWRIAVSGAILLFGVRLALSTGKMLHETLKVAGGSHVTLARRHPQWREPCLYVKERLDGAVVLTTTYLPTLYYVGRVDDWYPSKYLFWEQTESGLNGLATVEGVAKFMEKHPKGYFIAEYQRFGRWEFLADEVAWIESHMTRLEEASSADVIVYAWGMEDEK